MHTEKTMNAMKSVGLILTLALATGMAPAGSNSRVKKTMVNGIGWYASFTDAQAEAKRTNKPILFLSMFGRLDEDMPCANARTLRATLFKDPEFRKLATDDVIPAWEMVRSVPKIQIDFGDGKKITRTVRGNAVMYLCNSDGKVIDAFPGVYTSHDFIPAIKESIGALANADTATIIAYHKKLGFVPRLSITTASKAMVESPTLDMIGAQPFRGATSSYVADTAAKRLFADGAAKIIDLSLTPMNPAQVGMKLTGAPIEGRDPDMVAHEILQNDSLTNMNRMRPVIHLWMASITELPTPEQARDVILETILKIPYKDPYFGLRDVVLPGTPR